jgi:hypothetical protein
MRIFVIFFFVAKSVLAQDTASITQAELLHRTQIMYDAVATGVKAPWQQYLAGDAIIHDEKGASYTKPTFLATVEPLPSGYSGTIKVTHPQTIFADGVSIFSYDVEEEEIVFRNHMTDATTRQTRGSIAIISGRSRPARSCATTKILQPSRSAHRYLPTTRVPTSSLQDTGSSSQRMMGSSSLSEGAPHQLRCSRKRLTFSFVLASKAAACSVETRRAKWTPLSIVATTKTFSGGV